MPNELEVIRGRILHLLGDIQALVSYVDGLEGSSQIDRRPLPVGLMRKKLRWSRERLLSGLESEAAKCRLRLPDRKTLRAMVIGWESGLPPDPFYRELLIGALNAGRRESNISTEKAS